MVNTVNVSRYTGTPPKGVAERKIQANPLYTSCEVNELLRNEENQVVQPWTKKCIGDIQKLGFGEDDLPGLIKLAVNRGRFIGAEWCQQNPDGPWAACDSYSVIRREWIDAAYKEMDMEYYIKFAIGKSGRILLLVSCHPSEDRR